MNRKLAKEIDQTYKRINEGIDQFDRIHEKLSSAPTQSLRDKFEAELKKEIKKLQRCRDSIKQWLSGTEVKDKTELLKYRRLVETKMEQFKTVEKESKMKAYSKEALAKKTRDTKRKKLDKRGLRNIAKIEKWIDTLQEQVDEADDALQEIQESKRPDPEEVERLEDIVRRHKVYIEKLTETARLLKKGTIESADVEQISDDVEYYIEEHQDPDFYENELLFDTIMDKKEGTYEDDDEEEGELLEIPEVDEDAVQETLVDIPPQPVLRINDIVPGPTDEPEEEPVVEEKKKSKKDKKQQEKQQKPTTTATTTQPQEKKPKSKKNLTPTPAATVAPQPVVSYRDIIAADDKPADKGKKPSSSVVSSASSSPSPQVSNLTPKQSASPTTVYAPNVTPPATVTTNTTLGGFHQPAPLVVQTQMQDTTPTVVPAQQAPPAQVQQPPVQQPQNITPQQTQQTSQVPKLQARLSRAIPMEERLSRSLLSLPSDTDTEAPNAYVPKNPVEVPDFFPQERHAKFNSPEFFAKFETAEPLFFAFYFQQGDFQQELAARELKNKQWRFMAPKYMAWFKRHSPPNEVTEKYERGTYMYFDYDKEGWTPRIKQNFTLNFAGVFNG